eukprot:CAMPEP_0181243954 /NCGR_PEP_ID=MMETSP1096-20121128/42576_1 /TAXON_ID=156174 ORGANISM="Chrysochromulina ericina, Strain CCMP281" /NCGR_SAMPLE_ID=MMETSP1096 /ASSEMBLY_ACC=CAM_ASM_000453 /LENGTH=111 /DNA_ID=CAMNT_0023340419 /DNA_START=1539 /DNA_END=1874 /DNA_ORIENTATION=-
MPSWPILARIGQRRSWLADLQQTWSSMLNVSTSGMHPSACICCTTASARARSPHLQHTSTTALYVTAFGRTECCFILLNSSKATPICLVRLHAVMSAVYVIVSGVTLDACI